MSHASYHDSEFGTQANAQSPSCLHYRIRFRGRISAGWLTTLQNVTLSTVGRNAGAETTLVGRVPDQAALIGIVNMVYDLGGELISVNSTPCDVTPDIR